MSHTKKLTLQDPNRTPKTLDLPKKNEKVSKIILKTTSLTLSALFTQRALNIPGGHTGVTRVRIMWGGELITSSSPKYSKSIFLALRSMTRFLALTTALSQLHFNFKKGYYAKRRLLAKTSTHHR